MTGLATTSSVNTIQRALSARLEARIALALAHQARRALVQAPNEIAQAPARLILQSAEHTLARAQRRLADTERSIDLLA